MRDAKPEALKPEQNQNFVEVVDPNPCMMNTDPQTVTLIL
jgi:hypothetical protein